MRAMQLTMPTGDHPAANPPVTLEAELEKDVWDVRQMPGVPYLAHTGHHLLKFERVPLPFRPLVKRYLALCLTRVTFMTLRYQLRSIELFLQYFHERHPDIAHLQNLSRADIEGYLIHLRGSTMLDGNPASQNHVFRVMGPLQQLIDYLQRTDAPEAPVIPVNKLIWPEDRGKHVPHNHSSIKHIPDSVLAQLDACMHELPPTVLAVVIVLRASGWRISDVLNLRYDTCLEKTGDKWWLCGDITKTRVKAHRVPITPEIAECVKRQTERVRHETHPEGNPHHYLFLSNWRAHYPITASGVWQILNRLAAKHKITDDKGELYQFSLHSFRHTKAVELINNGMSMALVQQWMAHLTPEMTLAYAKILDPTMREQWERAMAQGAVRIDDSGVPRAVAMADLDDGAIEWEYIRHNLDAVRLPNGYCFKPVKAPCEMQEIPCHACHNFCTTPEFLPQFYKARDEAVELIQIGEQAGRTAWVQKNQNQLKSITPIIDLLETGKLHHPAGKAGREDPRPKEASNGS